MSYIKHDAYDITTCLDYTHNDLSYAVFWYYTHKQRSSYSICNTALYITTYLCVGLYSHTYVTPTNHDRYHSHSTVHHNVFMLGLYSHTTFLLSTTIHTSHTLLYITTCLCLDYTHTTFLLSTTIHTIDTALYITTCLCLDYRHTQRSSYQPRSIPVTQYTTLGPQYTIRLPARLSAIHIRPRKGALK